MLFQFKLHPFFLFILMKPAFSFGIKNSIVNIAIIKKYLQKQQSTTMIFIRHSFSFYDDVWEEESIVDEFVHWIFVEGNNEGVDWRR